jgi:4-diphosphocytidyl-2-C-methyl-D-erythritol kinase
MFETTAPAKLNLSLRILGKRDDGFHEIDTTMVRLPGLCDSLTFSEADAFSLTCDDASLPLDESNLVTRAVRAYGQAAGSPCHHHIHLTKRIPHGAGLGGGSSDAASTLMALNELNPKPLPSERLLAIAAELGSDVPFFLGPPVARCTGRGEILAPAPAPPRMDILLLKPSFPVLTPDAYHRWQNAPALAGVSYAEQNLDGLILINDLEPPVFAKHRFLAEMKTWLLQRDEVAAALLCGSGSTLFSVLHYGSDPSTLAAAARHELDPNLWHAAVSITQT